MLRKSLYSLGVLLLLVGLWGFYVRLSSGHEQAAYGSYVVWGLWVAEYVFFAGLAGGLLVLVTLVALAVTLRHGATHPLLKPLLALGLLLALFLSGGIGALFGVMASRHF